jgi:hypothetical protein
MSLASTSSMYNVPGVILLSHGETARQTLGYYGVCNVMYIHIGHYICTCCMEGWIDGLPLLCIHWLVYVECPDTCMCGTHHGS